MIPSRSTFDFCLPSLRRGSFAQMFLPSPHTLALSPHRWPGLKAQFWVCTLIACFFSWLHRPLISCDHTRSLAIHGQQKNDGQGFLTWWNEEKSLSDGSKLCGSGYYPENETLVRVKWTQPGCRSCVALADIRD